MALGDLDTRWKNPPGNSNEQLYLWAQDLIKELRKGDYLSNAIGGGIDNTQLADMAQSTIKGRAAGAGTGDPQDLTATQATAILNAFVGDSGSGGTKGLVPAPITGDAGKFLKGDGTWGNPSLVLLTSGTVSAAATLNLVLTSYTAYRGLRFVLSEWVPVTDDVELWMRLSTNAGSSYDSAAGNYRYSFIVASESAVGSNGTASATQIRISGNSSATQAVSNVAAERGCDAFVDLFAQTDTASWPRVTSWSGWLGADGISQQGLCHAQRVTAQDTDAVQFLFESGNISSGKYAVYGFN